MGFIMNEIFDVESNLDPHIEQMILTLRPTPQRAPEVVEMRRQRFIAELDSITVYKPRVTYPWSVGWFKPKMERKQVIPMTPRFAFATLAVLITVFTLLFGGAGATALAAQSALPGDTLYTIKTSLENTRVSLAGDAYDQAQLHLSYARLRLVEMGALVQKGRHSDIEMAAKEFEACVEKATSALQTVLAGNPERGTLLSRQITRALLSYASILEGMETIVPDDVQPAVEQAIITSRTSAGEQVLFSGVVESISDATWVISGRMLAIIDLTKYGNTIKVGDLVNVQAILGMDGTLTVQYIELSMAGAEPNDITSTNTDDSDDGAVNDVDDGAANNVDDGAVNDVDDGAVNDVDDGAVNDVDDGNSNQVDDGNANDNDDGDDGNNDDGDSDDGQNGNQ